MSSSLEAAAAETEGFVAAESDSFVSFNSVVNCDLSIFGSGQLVAAMRGGQSRAERLVLRGEVRQL